MRKLFLLPLLAMVGACDRAPADPRGVDRDETLLTVTATGRADARPDEARLQLGVQSKAGSAEEASRLNREMMRRVTDALARFGVAPNDLQTRNLSLQRIDYGKERGQFRADIVVEVKLRDMARVGDAVTAVTTAGANVLSGPELRVSDREGASRSAYAEAYRAARRRAEAYAGAADLRIARVLGIYDGGEYGVPSPPPVAVAPSALQAVNAEERAAPFNPGVNTSEVRVRVDFALARK